MSGTTPAALDQSLNSPKSGSPKGLALAESLHKAPGTNSATVASAGYQATDVHGTAASPKLRQQLDEFDAQFTTVAPLK